MNKESKTNFLPVDYLIDQAGEHMKMYGNPSTDKEIVFKQITKLRKMGALTPENEERLILLQIENFDGGDIF